MKDDHQDYPPLSMKLHTEAFAFMADTAARFSMADSECVDRLIAIFEMMRVFAQETKDNAHGTQ